MLSINYFSTANDGKEKKLLSHWHRSSSTTGSRDSVISWLLGFHYLLVIPFLPLLEGAETMDFEELSNLPQF